MAPVSRKYDERTLGPLQVKAAWWFRLPSQTRTRLRGELEEQDAPIGFLVGEVQDRLIAKGLARLMGTFMVAMQEGYDADAAEREELHETGMGMMLRFENPDGSIGSIPVGPTPAQDDADAEL